MKKVAILIDGGFYRKVSNHRWGDKTPEESVDDLIKYCHFHLKERDNFVIENGKKKYEYNELYRIFYYDCEPLDKIIYNPLTQKNVKFNESRIVSVKTPTPKKQNESNVKYMPWRKLWHEHFTQMKKKQSTWRCGKRAA